MNAWFLGFETKALPTIVKKAKRRLRRKMEKRKSIKKVRKHGAGVHCFLHREYGHGMAAFITNPTPNAFPTRCFYPLTINN
ncbi:hypothetical protein [Bergeyella sp. RCAD1439]|uniref:hypothetical protein n=1 Tax=Bergeyella anatis TaxID=3113737 RepID=UPI002E18B0A2|nr:hypothetical protein [Bergeyella sp. RCAD1439]